ncbi:DUF2280 domain-containing protein [Acinetobacter gerneri]|jgi:hypothetical protein|uniref:DUF2280 domain-containing protein n=1 Tax=Acinetobacter gerneri TaxID=202952 RepID=UPI0023EFD50A|nr:DUF2280 domain-containing protein [Acinetobacter gerneri]MCH4243742.1 DUF2280 domain-containing protein [Acinetobacter gerneri]
MAVLREPVKVFIVQSLACFETPQQVAESVKQNFNIEIERQQVAAYDPTKTTGKNLSKKLKDLFYKARAEFNDGFENIPIANKAFHFKELQSIYEDYSKNKVMRTKVLKQAQGLIQMGATGKTSNSLSEKELIELEMKRLELEKLRKEVNPPDIKPPEEDYKVVLRPDEDIPDEPIL